MAWGVDFGILEAREFASDPINGNQNGGTMPSNFFGVPCGFQNDQPKFTVTLFGNKEGTGAGQPLTWADLDTINIAMRQATGGVFEQWKVLNVNVSEFPWSVGNTVLTVPQNHVFSATSGAIFFPSDYPQPAGDRVDNGYNGPCNTGLSTNQWAININPGISTPAKLESVFDPSDPAVSGCLVFPNNCFLTFTKNIPFFVPNYLTSCAISNLSIAHSFPCDPITNTYDLLVRVEYSNEPATGTLDVNGQSFAITASPQDCLLTGLIADGLPLDVTAVFSDDAGCTLTVPSLFNAPGPCACTITNLIATTQPCNPINNTYTADVTVTYENDPGVGTLDVNGQSFPITSSPQTVTLGGLVADGNPVNVTANFSADTGCTFTSDSLFTAPVPCTCDILTLSANPGSCDTETGTYFSAITVTYTNEPTVGTLDINGQSFPITGSPQVATLTGLIADGNPVTVIANFSDNPSCQNTAISLYTAPEPCSDCGECPIGYIFNPATGLCDINAVENAVYTGDSFILVKGEFNAAFNREGMRLYPNVTNLSLPILGTGTGFSTTEVYTITDNMGAPVVPLLNGINNGLWGSTTNSCGNTNSVDNGGRLNQVGVWNNSFPTNEELCFEFCFTIESGVSEKTIGLSGDNEFRFYVDGVLVVDFESPYQSGAGPAQTPATPFKYWHIFPYEFTAGDHVIKVCGLNKWSSASFGAEIYELTGADIANNFSNGITGSGSTLDCGNEISDLEPFILFSTIDMVGVTVADPNSGGVWECPDQSFDLNPCGSPFICTKTESILPLGCCYTVKDCSSDNTFDILINTNCDNTSDITVNVGEIWKFSLDPLSTGSTPPLDPYKCYEIIEFKNPCEATDLSSYCVGERLTDCSFCEPCFVCTNCNDEAEKIYFKWDPELIGDLPDLTKTYTFSFDTTKCWNCEIIEEPCIPPNVFDITKKECSGDQFIVNNYLTDLVQNSGTYTYEFYIDPTYNTLWSENTAGWTPTSYPTGYVGSIITLYVKIYEDGCSLPSNATLSLEWKSCQEAETDVTIDTNVTTGQTGGILIIIDNP